MTVVDAIRVGGKQEGRQKERVTRKEKENGEKGSLEGDTFFKRRDGEKAGDSRVL